MIENENLTPEQIARIPEFVEKWSQIGLSTAPADRPMAERGIRHIYEAAGLNPPKVVWSMSPLANGLVRAIIQQFSQVVTVSYSDLINISGRSAESNAKSVIDFLRTNTRDSMTGGIGDNIWRGVIASVEDSAGTSIDRINSGVEYSIGEPIPETIMQPLLISSNVLCNIWRKDDENKYYAMDDWIKEIIGYFDTWDEHITFKEGQAPLPIRMLESHCVNKVKARIRNVEVIVEAGIEASVKISASDIHRDTVYEGQTGYFFDQIIPIRRKGQLGENVEDGLGARVAASIRHSLRGQHEAAALALLDYLRSVCGRVNETEKLIGHWEQAQAAGWYLPHENVCWVSERPNVLHLNNQYRLHCDNGPALAYPDGWSIYALDGMLVNPKYVLTPADQMDPQTILKEKDVYIRRELLRKVGISRMIRYGKKIDQQGDYKLIDMSRIFRGSDIRYAPYLLKQSASVDGAQHLEVVSPECRTVEQAINWRASEAAKNWKPDQSSPYP